MPAPISVPSLAQESSEIATAQLSVSTSNDLLIAL